MKVFKHKRVSARVKVLPGTGTFTVDVPFVPDYIRVDYSDIQHHAGADTIEWNLGLVTSGQYTLTVAYACGEERMIHYVVAKLPVDPEQTISF